MAKLPFYRGGKGGAAAVTPKNASAQMVRRQIRIPVGDFTQNTTTKYSRGPLGFACKVLGAYYSARTKPAGGTLSITIVAYDASANAEVVISEALDPEAVTVREGAAFTLAGTNPSELAADDTIELHVAADNNAVGTQQVDGYVTLVVMPTEDSLGAAGLVTTGADL